MVGRGDALKRGGTLQVPRLRMRSDKRILVFEQHLHNLLDERIVQ